MSGRGKSRGRAGSAAGGRGGRGGKSRGRGRGGGGAGGEAPVAPDPKTKIISPFETIAHRSKHPVINKRVRRLFHFFSLHDYHCLTLPLVMQGERQCRESRRRSFSRYQEPSRDPSG
jgi:hypothetical protein